MADRGPAAGDLLGPFSSAVRSNASSAAVDLAACLGGSAAAACFAANRVGTMSVVSGALTSAPVLNNNNPTLTTGPTVTLSWTPPVVGFATSYTIEASSTPGGPADLANYATGNPQTSIVAQGVPPRIYFVRVRAVDADGPSAPSNEVQMIVTSGGSSGGCPSAPQSLKVVFQKGTVTMTWLPPATGVATSYVIQAGSAAGLANLANRDTGSAALSFVATGVPANTYYIRVYGLNSACSSPGSIGPSSNEVTIGGTTGGATGGWGGQILCHKNVSGPFNYHHDETQTWDVRATVPQAPTGRTLYPFDWRSTGSGGRSFGATDANWTVTGAVGAGQLSVFSNSAGINFVRVDGPTVIHGGLAGTPTSYDDYEFLFLPFTAPIGSTRATGSRTYTGQPCDTPVTPAGSVCTVVCTWDLSLR
jgi:hypothetical protein